MRQQIKGNEESEREEQPEPLAERLVVQVGLDKPENKIDQPDGVVIVKPVPPAAAERLRLCRQILRQSLLSQSRSQVPMFQR
jgi:hypothetical protein